jgi:hypothetical protein
MKKILLSLGVVLATASLNAQVIFRVEAPASIEGSKNFTSNGDGSSWGLTTLVGTAPVIDTVVLANDGTPGVNAQGFPSYAGGCAPLPPGSLAGKIAMVYRYDGASATGAPGNCGFGVKALNCQNAGAIAVIIVNREFGTIAMNGGTEGATVTIPVTFVSNEVGEEIYDAIQAGDDVVAFIGDKTGYFQDDISIFENRSTRPNFGSKPSFLTDDAAEAIDMKGFAFNYGQNDQVGVTVTTTVTRGATTVYTETTTPFALLSGDSAAFEFTPLPQTLYNTIGDYNITYTTAIAGVTDEFTGDNTAVHNFDISTDLWSLARLTAVDTVAADNYFRPATLPSTSFQTCKVIQGEDNASPYAITSVIHGGVTKAVADSIAYQISGLEARWTLSEWDAGDYTITGAAGAISLGSEVASGGFFFDNSYVQESQFEMIVETPSTGSYTIEPGQNYLLCFVVPDVRIFSAFSSEDYYDENGANDDLVRVPLLSDATWSVPGFGIAPSIALKVEEYSLSIGESVNLDATVYPNPATDKIRIQLPVSGDATMTINDMSGRFISTEAVQVENGFLKSSVSTLSEGSYLYTITFENGAVSRFNVVVTK